MCRIRRRPAGPAVDPGADHAAVAPAQRRSDLVAVRRVRDQLDRAYAGPLDVEALARAEGLSAGHLSTQFRLAYGESPASYLEARRLEAAAERQRCGPGPAESAATVGPLPTGLVTAPTP